MFLGLHLLKEMLLSRFPELTLEKKQKKKKQKNTPEGP